MYKIYMLLFCIASVFISRGKAESYEFFCGKADNIHSTITLQSGGNWIDIQQKCVSAVKKQIHEELRASVSYLALASHFSKDKVNRPGFAKFFFESASEEREHAIKLMHYLTMRGELTDVQDLIAFPEVAAYNKDAQNTEFGLEALKIALDLEVTVTKSIKNLIKTCDSEAPMVVDGVEMSDYHITDWLTAEYLDEQYKGQRELAGKIVTLTKLMETNADKALSEFIFDKKLLGINI